MPPNLTRVTVDLEGRVRKFGSGRRVNLVPVNPPVNVEVNLSGFGYDTGIKEYVARVHEAVNKLPLDELPDELPFRTRPPKAVAYCANIADKKRQYVDEGQTEGLGLRWVPVQFYKRPER